MIRDKSFRSIQDLPTVSDTKIINQKNVKAPKDPNIDKAAKMYEQVFLKEMVEAMRKAVPKSELMEQSMAQKIYEDQMYENYVEEWTNSGGVGLSDVIYDQIVERYYPEKVAKPPKGQAIPMNEPKPYDMAPSQAIGNKLDKKI